MMTWAKKKVREWTGVESEIERLHLMRKDREQKWSDSRAECDELKQRLDQVKDHRDEARKEMDAKVNLIIELRDQLCRVEHERDQAEHRAEEQMEELRKQTLAHSCEVTRAATAEAKLARLAHYFADLPATRDDLPWKAEDATALAAMLDTPLGKRVMQHLTNRLADYTAAAVDLAPRENAYVLCARARGFRDCRGELLRLSAAGPSPANHESPGFSLPDELENLRAD